MSEAVGLAEQTDASRAELLAAIEEANDRLADTMRQANIYQRHDEVRPSAIRAFDEAEEAVRTLVAVDPTRSFDDQEGETDE